MSLMNQVLRDLQQRQIAPVDEGLQTHIDPVQLPGNYLRNGSVLLGCCLLIAFALWLIFPVLSQAPVPVPVTQSYKVESENLQRVTNTSLPGIHLTALRLETEPNSSRLLLEFSQVPGLEPEILRDGRRLRVLLPELMTTAQELPQTNVRDALIAHLALVKIDNLWQLQVDFNVDVRVESVPIKADLLHGERLALDFFPVSRQSPSVEKQGVVRAAVLTPGVATATATSSQIASKKVGVQPALLKREYVLSPQEKAQNFYQKGILASQNEHWQEAVDLWLHALTLQPDHIMSRKRAIFALLPADIRQADQLFSAGMALHNSLDFRKWYARTLLPVLGPAQALRILSEQNVQVVEDAEYIALEAALWQQTGEFSKSEQAYVELLKSFPGNEIYLFGLAVALDQQTKGDEALRYYRMALSGLEVQTQKYASQRIAALSAGGARN